MRRVLASVIGLTGLLAACDATEVSRRAIEEACLANGDAPEVCTCLARESAERLDPAVLDVMVIGAQGEPRQATLRARGLSDMLQSQFAVEVPAIMAECGMARS